MVRKLLATVVLFIMPYMAHADCDYLFQKNDGVRTGLSTISHFVVDEIRPLISEKEHMFKVNIYRKCDGGSSEKIITIDMKSNNYYLLWINGVKLPQDIVRYDNRLEIDIDRETLIWSIEKAVNLDFSQFKNNRDAKTYAEKKELMYQHAVLKMFAFVFAEAARFESAEIALRKTIEGNCSIDWHDFDFIVHAWRHTSDYIRLTGKVEKEQYFNDWREPLYSPITLAQETAYEKALMRGESFEFNRTVPFHEYEYVCN